jgi:hypothetical protein
MKINHLIKDITIIINNEEREFIENHNSTISLSSLSEHDTWTAQNLVRKGMYRLTNDNKNIILTGRYDKK